LPLCPPLFGGNRNPEYRSKTLAWESTIKTTRITSFCSQAGEIDQLDFELKFLFTSIKTILSLMDFRWTRSDHCAIKGRRWNDRDGSVDSSNPEFLLPPSSPQDSMAHFFPVALQASLFASLGEGTIPSMSDVGKYTACAFIANIFVEDVLRVHWTVLKDPSTIFVIIDTVCQMSFFLVLLLYTKYFYYIFCKLYQSWFRKPKISDKRKLFLLCVGEGRDSIFSFCFAKEPYRCCRHQRSITLLRLLLRRH
jgi:hypothetical protein